MFRVALVLIRSVLGSSHQIAECPGLYEILDRLRHIPAEFKEQEYLVREVIITLRKKFNSFRAIFTVIVREENLVFLFFSVHDYPSATRIWRRSTNINWKSDATQQLLNPRKEKQREQQVAKTRDVATFEHVSSQRQKTCNCPQSFGPKFLFFVKIISLCHMVIVGGEGCVSC